MPTLSIISIIRLGKGPVEHATNWALKERTRAVNWFGLVFVEDRVVISSFEMRNLSKPKLQGAHTVHYKYNKVRERPSGTCHKLGLEGADKGSKLVWVWSLWRTELLFPF